MKRLSIFLGFCALAILTAFLLFLNGRKNDRTPRAANSERISNVPSSRALRTQEARPHLNEAIAASPKERLDPAPVLAVVAPAEHKETLVNILKQVPKPKSALATKFTPQDEAMLLAAYRNTSNLTARSGLIWVLAHIGGDETAQTFMNTLTSEFRGRTLIGDEGGSRGSEEAVMQTLVGVFGLLASRSEVAWDFLKQGINPKYWQQNVGWKSSTGNAIFGLLSASAIQSLGMAEHRDAPALIRQLKQQPPEDAGVVRAMRREFDGDMVQAAFYAALRAQKGNDGFYQWLLDTPVDQFDADGAYSRWTATPEGAEWKRWYDQRLAVQK